MRWAELISDVIMLTDREDKSIMAVAIGMVIIGGTLVALIIGMALVG